MHIVFSHAWRVVVALAGAVLVVAGIVLWILPVVPGLFLVFVGLPMVMGVHPRGRALYARWLEQGKARVQAWRSRHGWRRR